MSDRPSLFRRLVTQISSHRAGTWRLTLCGALLAAVTTASLVPGLAAEKQTNNAKPDEAAQSGDKPPLGKLTVLVPKKDFKTEGPAKALRVSFDDVDIEKVLNTKQLTADIPEKMPDWLRKLDGQRIRMRGYMHPASAFQEEGIKRFVLCRDTGPCCFGPKPTVYYLVDVSLKNGVTTSYVENKAFDVEGVFHIKPELLEGSNEVDRFYFLDNAQVIKK